MTDSTRLLTELTAVVPSCASTEALARCPLLLGLAVPPGDSASARELILDAIGRLGTTPGRTTDSARANLSYAQVESGLLELFGPTASAVGIEKRYERVAIALGNTTAMSGRRVTPRLLAYLADAILGLTSERRKRHTASAGTTDEWRSEPEMTTRAAEVLRGQSESIADLVDLALDHGLFRDRAWQTPLREAARSLFSAETDKHDALSRCQQRLDDITGNSLDTMAVLALLLDEGVTPHPLPRGWLDQLSRLLQSPEDSAALPPSMTFLRIASERALTQHHIFRPGTGTVSTERTAIPDFLFAEMPVEDTGNHLLVSIFPVTVSQYDPYLASIGRSLAVSPETPTCPAVNVSLREAMEYCSWYRALAGSKPLCIKERNGDTISLACSIVDVVLPSREQFVLMTGERAAGHIYPWSGVISDELGLSRRDSYSELIPVGLFPDEPSVVGAYDVAGLIWQWSSTRWSEQATPTRTPRMHSVYGGGVGANHRFFTTETFLGADPLSRRPDRGFRICLLAK